MSDRDQDLEGAGAEALKALETDQTAQGSLNASDREDATPEEAAKRLTRAQVAQILDRGVVTDKLSLKLPPDRVGYWIRERQDDIDRILALGGRIERLPPGQAGLHGAGDDRIRVGDVIAMSLPREIVDVISQIDEANKLKLKDKGKQVFLKNKVPGVPHYEEV